MSIDWEKFLHFQTRTNYHILLVNKYLDRIIKLKNKQIDTNIINKEKNEHDESKFKSPEIYWNYKLQDQGDKVDVSKDDQNRIQSATFHHVKTNRHHPEYWDNSVTIEVINSKDRDSIPTKAVDATLMPESYVACLVADWCAISDQQPPAEAGGL